MKRLLLAAIFAILTIIPARAQVVMINETLMNSRMSRVSVKVTDAENDSPVSFASVYLIPAKDTVISNFTLTDTTGLAELPDIPYGSYSLHIEMMGYKPYIADKFFRNYREDLGTVKLETDISFIQAATVTDYGNPIVIKKDTIEFNAASYQIGTNDMLRDLIKRMPGMEITSDGKVKFNGEVIDKITVGGRTFFFGDQSTALNNLPAQIIDKVSVIDKATDEARATGIDDGTRKKTIDIKLKKEYEKGWFGNVAINGGSTIPSGKRDPLIDDERGFLYAANGLAAMYNETDQITAVGSTQNVNNSNGFYVSGDDIDMNLVYGLTKATQLGINANTTRLKDIETTAMVNWRSSDTDNASTTNRTTFQDSGDLSADSKRTSNNKAGTISTRLQMKKEKGNVWFHFSPQFSRTVSSNSSSSESTTFREGAFVNSSSAAAAGANVRNNAQIHGDIAFRNLGGTKGRNLRFGATVSGSGNEGTSEDHSLIRKTATQSTKDLNYESNGQSRGISGAVRYAEPVSSKLTLAANAAYDYSISSNNKDAFDSDGFNDYYSTESKTTYFNQRYTLTGQFKMNGNNSLTLGADLNGTLNETFTKNRSISTVTGAGETIWFLSPNINYQYNKDNLRLNTNASGSTSQPSAMRMMPILDISNPSRLWVGNIYLKPQSTLYFRQGYTTNNKERFTFFSASASINLRTNQETSASWYDTDGIMYSIPVNATKPTVNAYISLNGSVPLNQKKNLNLSSYVYLDYSGSQGFVAKGTLPSLSLDAFDYASFMAGFWGDEHGDLFYSGDSGFSSGYTSSVRPIWDLDLRYKEGGFSATLSFSTSQYYGRSTISEDMNVNQRSYGSWLYLNYATKSEWEFENSIGYRFHRGFSENYGKPECRWNASLSKNLGPFSIKLEMDDILDQKRNLVQNITSNWSEETYHMAQGRYILIGLRWNFGKMNAANSRRASNAAWQLSTE